jgi:hypothetical protein
LFSLTRNAVLDKLEDAIEITEGAGKVVLLQFSRDENFKALLKLDDKELLRDIDLFEYGFDQKDT